MLVGFFYDPKAHDILVEATSLVSYAVQKVTHQGVSDSGEKQRDFG
ncbi:hypothetical protein [Lacticaseibacillus rhamnosus]|nr:hypothetical protein [Lacticaseibacillus rhamnosus]